MWLYLPPECLTDSASRGSASSAYAAEEADLTSLSESPFPHRSVRNDRLRLLGNGVVPLQAAAALVELARRLNGG
mgnify:CR=1